MTSTIASAKVVDPQKNPELQLLLKDTDWITWLLIEERTLRELNADAKLKEEAVKELEAAQKELETTTDELNFLKRDNYAIHIENNELKREIFDLKHPPWYKQPAVWGSAGIALGVAATIVALAYGGAF